MNLASFRLIQSEERTEFRPTKIAMWLWKYSRHIILTFVLLMLVSDLFIKPRPMHRVIPMMIFNSMALFGVFAAHSISRPKPFIIDRMEGTISHQGKVIPFDDLVHFTVEAATFRDKVVMVTKKEKIDLTGGLSTKKAEALRDILVDSIPFPLPRPGYFQSKIAVSE